MSFGSRTLAALALDTARSEPATVAAGGVGPMTVAMLLRNTCEAALG